MAIGERIRFIRKLRGMTQKRLGMSIGFSENTADVRMAQYESGARTPKEKMLCELAQILDVSRDALVVPDIDSYIGLMHTLFTLEDLYGFKVNKIDDELCLTVDRADPSNYLSMFDMLNVWYKEADKFRSGEITKEEYDAWRYNYPRIKAERLREKMDELRASDNAEPTE